MPNEVYKAAVKGLGALVAPKAARRLVDEALRASNRTSDDVSEAAMRRLLLTRVKRELAGILPDHVVVPSLERVAADLATAENTPARRGLFGRRRSGSAAASAETRRSKRDPRKTAGLRPAPEYVPDPELVDPFDSDELEGEAFTHEALDSDQQRAVKASSVYLPAVDLPEFLPDYSGPRPEAPTTRSQPAAPERARAGGLSVPAANVDRVIRTFADLETVRQIVVVNGMSVTQVRGEGLETDRLAALTVATRGLLARAGDLRVFSVEIADGVLFLFPTRDGAIVVLTQPKVNIGAVLAARAVLEEAA
ncbi:MAG TPA: hypothetical protein VFN03_10055 [Trueperaceae bacterium]|nr:hypothetical protein [Trueperaceae bacterium]